jgi:predicted transcriptional regulator of viral defense system
MFCYTVHMSTVKRNITQARFANLARLGEVVFRVEDLANLWQITSKNNLHTTLKRYCQQGLIFRVFRGLYAIKPLLNVDPFVLGLRAAGEFAYLSTESTLVRDGIIQQSLARITIVGQKSQRFTLLQNEFRVRQLADQYLFNPAGIVEKDGIRLATTERAVADLLYFNPKAFFDGGGNVDWKKVRKIQAEIGYLKVQNK